MSLETTDSDASATAFTPSVRVQVIIGATVAAGPGASEDDVLSHVRGLLARLDPTSACMRAFDAAEPGPQTVPVKKFRATVLHVDQETTSTRAVLFLKTRPSTFSPNGREIIRTDRLDGADQAGLAMARLAQTLIGHEVMLTVAVEKTATGSARVLREIADISQQVVPGFNATEPEFAPDFSLVKNIADLRSVQAQAAAQTS